MDDANKPGQDQLDAWHDNPANWKLGVFYFNPDDKRLFPPKRLRGTGWTVNFANPFSILTMLIVIIVVVAVSALFH